MCMTKTHARITRIVICTEMCMRKTHTRTIWIVICTQMCTKKNAIKNYMDRYSYKDVHDKNP